jgi:hypothetical protein
MASVKLESVFGRNPHLLNSPISLLVNSSSGPWECGKAEGLFQTASGIHQEKDAEGH